MAERFKGGTGRIETNATAHNRVMSQEITDRRARNSAKVMLEQVGTPLPTPSKACGRSGSQGG